MRELASCEALLTYIMYTTVFLCNHSIFEDQLQGDFKTTKTAKLTILAINTIINI